MGIKRYVALMACAVCGVGLHAEQLRLQDLEGTSRGFARPSVTLPSEAIKNLPDDITTAKQDINGASYVLDKLIQTYHAKGQTLIKEPMYSMLGRCTAQLQTLLKRLEHDVSDLGSVEAEDAVKAAINMIQVEMSVLDKASQEEVGMAVVAVNSVLNHARIKARGQIATAKAKSPDDEYKLETKMQALNETLQQVYYITNAMTSALNVSSIED